ncbi:MAG TPA: cation transporter [Stellaceae bacterium]|nr:cation transporter [Stellaceae bacterium]
MSRLLVPLLAAAVVASAVPASAAERTVTLAVDNMTCELCPPIVKKSLARVPGVAKTDVSAERHTATVVFDDQRTTLAALLAATTNAGYPSRPVQ